MACEDLPILAQCHTGWVVKGCTQDSLGDLTDKYGPVLISFGENHYAKDNRVSDAVVASFDRLGHCPKENENTSTGPCTCTR